LAAAAAIEYKHFQKIEGAAWPGVRLDTVERLAKALNVSMAELLAEEGMEVRRARMD
jgi:DNA-binding Xre family transcriptional regulator